MVRSVQLFTALLAVVAIGITVAVVVAALARRHGPARAFLGGLRPVAVPLAFAVALTATLGSLYFSEVANYVPCTLCWYQRIAMYPLALLLGVAWLTRDHRVGRFTIPLAAIGSVVATYHVLVERFPDLESDGICSAGGPPCSVVWFERLGFVTLPTMALAGFACVIALSAVAATGDRTPAPADAGSADAGPADAGAAEGTAAEPVVV